MKKVNLYKLNDDGTSTVVVVFELIDGEVVVTGDKHYIDPILEKGIIDYESEDNSKLLITDGERFMRQLQYNFRSGYLEATEIIEE